MYKKNASEINEPRVRNKHKLATSCHLRKLLVCYYLYKYYQHIDDESACSYHTHTHNILKHKCKVLCLFAEFFVNAKPPTIQSFIMHLFFISSASRRNIELHFFRGYNHIFLVYRLTQTFPKS